MSLSFFGLWAGSVAALALWAMAFVAALTPTAACTKTQNGSPAALALWAAAFVAAAAPSTWKALKSYRDPRGPCKSPKEPGGSRRSQEEPGGARRRSQEEPREAWTKSCLDCMAAARAAEGRGRRATADELLEAKTPPEQFAAKPPHWP